MLKNFFIAFLGTLAALWVSFFIFVVGFVLLLVVSIGSGLGSVNIQEHSILWLDLHGSISERESIPNVSEILGSGYDNTVPSLSDMINAVSLAADDDKIDGIFIDCGDAELGYASRYELMKAIDKFKKSGKWVYAYGDTYSQGDYFVATTATRIFANPSGSVDVHGIASTIPFFKTALDKIGVDVQVFKVGTFKSAVEPYLLTEMSEPSRLQTATYLDSIWNNVSGVIAANRGVGDADVAMWADSMIVTRQSAELIDNKIVDEICYRREVEAKMRELTNLDEDEDLRLVTAADYMAYCSMKGNKNTSNINNPHIALLYAVGDIVDTGTDGIVASDMVPLIIELADDENVKGLVMRVNSPGGSAYASEQIWDALQYFKSKGKPFYVSMGDYAASGGYYISSGADVIFADTETLTGSIGIFGLIPCAKQLFNNHLGISFSTVSTNTNAAFPQIVAPMTDYQYASMQKSVENGYALFTKRVAEGRNMDINDVLQIAEGRVWDGGTALTIGLVDQIGTLEDALSTMAQKTGLDRRDVIDYPMIQLTPLEMLLLGSSMEANSGKPLADDTIITKIDGLTPNEVREYIKVLERLTKFSHIQARMEDVKLY